MTNQREIKKRIPIISLLLREKKFLINSSFQIQFMASLIIVSLVSMSIIYIANDYFFHSYIARGQALNLPPDHPFFLMIHEQKKFMTQVFIMVSIAISSVAAIWGLFYSHKIAGPLYRLHLYFSDAAVSARPLDRKIYFREDDFFQEIPDSINNYIDSVDLKNERNENENETKEDVAA
jgi:hypothetical protein